MSAHERAISTSSGHGGGRGPVAVVLGSIFRSQPAITATARGESESSAAVQAVVTLVRGPYLQQVGADRAIVVWATRESGAAHVEYRTGTGPLLVAAATSTFRASSATGIPNFYQHEATLTGLQLEHDVSVRSPRGGRRSDAGRRRRSSKPPPPAGTGTIRLVAFGDSGLGSSAQGQIAARLAADTFDVALHTGDMAYSRGTYAEFEARFFPYYRDWLRRQAILPSIGNHDDMTGSATPLRQLFVLPRDGGSAAYPNNAERFYSVDYGPVHLIALDTQAAFLSTARRQEQLAWLASDLAGGAESALAHRLLPSASLQRRHRAWVGSGNPAGVRTVVRAVRRPDCREWS